jgi:hypothetical protein
MPNSKSLMKKLSSDETMEDALLFAQNAGRFRKQNNKHDQGRL